jgi:hypothetical protein
LYVLVAPTSWVAQDAGLTAAHAEICQPAFELATWAKQVLSPSTRALTVVRPDDLVTRQLPLVGGAAKSWMRRVWDPQAGSWSDFAEEKETIDQEIHVPKEWNRQDPKYGYGGTAYPSSLSGDAGSPLIAPEHWNEDGYPSLYDPAEGVSKGALPKLLPTDVDTDADLDEIAAQASRASESPLVGEWRSNGRFYGNLHIPDAVVRANQTVTLGVTAGELACDQPPLLPWKGKTGSASSSCWSGTAVAAPHLQPFWQLPDDASGVSGGWISVSQSDGKVTVSLETLVAGRVTLVIDMNCPVPGTEQAVCSTIGG